MIVNPDSAVPLWRQVAAWIAGRIAEPGQRLPSEATIMQELGVSRGTVRQAATWRSRGGPWSSPARARSRPTRSRLADRRSDGAGPALRGLLVLRRSQQVYRTRREQSFCAFLPATLWPCRS